MPEDIFQGKVNLGMQITETANHFLSRDTKKMQEPPFLFCIIGFAFKNIPFVVFPVEISPRC